MDVVGGDQAKVEIAGDINQAAAIAPLLLDAVIGELDEEILLSEKIPVGSGRFQCLGVLSLAQGHVDLTLEATTQGNESLAVLGQEFTIDAWLVVEAV